VGRQSSLSSSPVRVALYGNMCNFLFQIAKSLRVPDASGQAIDAHLFIERSADLQNLPESDDPELAGRYPDWIHVGDWLQGPARALAIAYPPALPVLAQWKQFDLIVVSAEGPCAARFTGKPYIFLTGGGDLTLMPFADRAAALDAQPGLLKSLAWRLRAHWQRKGIADASAIVTQPFKPFLDALKQLGITPDRIAGTTSLLALDTDRFQRVPSQEITWQGQQPDRLRASDFVVFHPSRMMIRDTEVLRATGQWKANDSLLRGFAAFVAKGTARRPLLALIDRVHSLDIALAKAEIRRLGIEEHVIWLNGSSPEGFTRHELIELYSLSHVVADDFGAGWFGSVALEACATECTVLTYVDEKAMGAMYPWHPFVNARTPDEIAAQLALLFRDPARRAELGRQGRAWAIEFHASQQPHAGLTAEIAKLVKRPVPHRA
jgi:glycosyltransferase involved in cell wall biosynthesis